MGAGDFYDRLAGVYDPVMGQRCGGFRYPGHMFPTSYLKTALKARK